MTCSENKMEFYRGDDVAVSFSIVDPDDQPIALNGYKIMYTIKRQPADVDLDALLQKNYTIPTTPATNLASIILTNIDTAALPVGTFYYDFQIVSLAGIVNTVLADTVQVKSDITRRIVWLS